MPNVNFYSDEDYKLSYKTYQRQNWEPAVYCFTCCIFGKEMESVQTYTTKAGAIKAGRKWIKENIHDDCP